MRKLLCRILTGGKHWFRLRNRRYRCVYCRALRYQLKKQTDTDSTIPVPYKLVTEDTES